MTRLTPEREAEIRKYLRIISDPYAKFPSAMASDCELLLSEIDALRVELKYYMHNYESQKRVIKILREQVERLSQTTDEGNVSQKMRNNDK